MVVPWVDHSGGGHHQVPLTAADHQNLCSIIEIHLQAWGVLPTTPPAGEQENGVISSKARSDVC